MVEHEVPSRLHGDPVRLRQVIINLVGNALKFTEQGQVLIRVSLQTASEQEICLRVEVVDTGIGIDRQQQKNLFKPFVQGDGDHEFINIHGWLIQFVEGSHNKLWVEAIENAQILVIYNREAFVIDKEHLVAMWLFAGRAKDYQKIAMFVDAEILDYNKLTEILERHDLLAKWKSEKWRFTDEQR